MIGSPYRRDVKKKILMILDILLGIYLINMNLKFLGSFSLGDTVNNFIFFIVGLLLILNFLYLLFFSRRVRLM
ncbi:MAG: hypothetical protein Q8Q04_00015 [archaeon]|nr:hypothetical protein [archaeon]